MDLEEKLRKGQTSVHDCVGFMLYFSVLSNCSWHSHKDYQRDSYIKKKKRQKNDAYFILLPTGFLA